MILRTIKLPEFNVLDRDVNTYVPVFLDPPNTEIIGIGSEMGFFKSPIKIDRMRIYEQFGAHLYAHDVAIMNSKYYPIATRWRNGFGAIKKIYSGSIFDLMLSGGEKEAIFYQDLPITPFAAILEEMEKILTKMEISNKSIKDLKASKDKNLLRIIPEFYLLVENLPSSLVKNDMDGFLDNEATLLRSSHILHTIKDLITNQDSGRKRALDRALINEITTMMNNLKSAQLPFEKSLALSDEEIDKIIEDAGIYYPKESQLIVPHTALDHDGQFLNFPLLNFLRYCDLMLPDTCKIVFNKNKCEKFTYSEDTFKDFWLSYFPKFINKPEVQFPAEFNKKVEDCYHRLLSDLLTLMRYRTGFDETRYPVIAVEKNQGVTLTLTIIDNAGVETVRHWDLTMLSIASPAQYGVTI